MLDELRKDALMRYAHGLKHEQVTTLYSTMRGSPRDLRAMGLRVAVHNDYDLNGESCTFWLLTGKVGEDDRGRPIIRAFKGEGSTDEQALDQVRAAYAEATDRSHHAPLCPANHYHGMRAPTAPCSCGAPVERRK
jgi:hypothetical protein